MATGTNKMEVINVEENVKVIIQIESGNKEGGVCWELMSG